MTSLGMGAMLHILGGGSKNSADKYYGRKIVLCKTDESPDDYNSMGRSDRGSLRIEFDDGIKIKIWDSGQSCCEHRYMTTDDNPSDLVGQTLVSVECREAEAPKKDEDYSDSHDICFVVIQGDKSAITIATHNEHNGYYGGFGLTIDEVK